MFGDTEGQGVINGQATVSVPDNVDGDLTISLSSSNQSRLTVPASVKILDGAKTVSFAYTVVDNNADDGDVSIAVFGQAVNHVTGSDMILVKDNDP